MKKIANRYAGLLALLATLAIILSSSVPALAQDDGARSYWNARAGTNIFSFQYLPMNMGASGSKTFAPGQYIYPNADAEANLALFRDRRFQVRPPGDFALVEGMDLTWNWVLELGSGRKGLYSIPLRA